MEKISILMLEDSTIDADLSLARLRRANLNFEAKRVDTRAQFEEAVCSERFDIILADYALPDFDGISALEFAKKLAPQTPFIVVSGVLGEEHAIDALHRGATDYVLKPRLDRLAPSVERAISQSRLRAERARASEELQNAQEFARRLIESSRDCIVTVRPDGSVLSVNSYGIRTLCLPELTAEHLLTWREIWEGGDVESAQAAIDNATAGGIASFEGVSRTRAGELCYWDVLVTPIVNAHGNVEQILSIGRDVTERRNADVDRQRLLAREKQARTDAEIKAIRLQQSIEDLELFASIASHDLKEPLRTVTMYCQLLGSRCRDVLDHEALEYLRYVEQGTRRMGLLLRDLLSYSQVVHNEGRDKLTDMAEVVQEAIGNCAVAIEESNAQITVDPLPSVRVQRLQMVQLFQNLIGNAIKYRTREKPVIRITCSMQGTEWLFGVEDNGIGFDPKYAERIFGIFKRLHGEEYPGTGIGLAICRRVIERHHGRIWAEAEKGRGARFLFSLPVAEGSGQTEDSDTDATRLSV